MNNEWLNQPDGDGFWWYLNEHTYTDGGLTNPSVYRVFVDMQKAFKDANCYSFPDMVGKWVKAIVPEIS